MSNSDLTRFQSQETAFIFHRLRAETADAHSALEGQLPVFDPKLSLDRYRQLLIRLYGYYLPLEECLLSDPQLAETQFDYTERAKSPLIEADLLALGETPTTISQIPRCTSLPVLVTRAELFGGLYVIESATLRSQAIRRHLQAKLGLTLENGGAFFSGYDSDTMRKWNEFSATLVEAAAEFGDDDGIVESARRTCETLENWLGQSPGV